MSNSLDRGNLMIRWDRRFKEIEGCLCMQREVYVIWNGE